MQLFAFLIEIIVHCSIEDYNSELPESLTSYKACTAFHRQHLIDLAVYELYECSTFKQMLEFPGVELIYRLQVTQFNLQAHFYRKNDHGPDARNSFI